jgi:DNA-binding transcriptional LysR family regulator
MRLKKLDLNLLVAFRALMTHQNVSTAARDLGITQPALSHALTRLRAHYEDPLFFRAKGVMQPSPRAFEIYEPIAEALEQIAGTFDSTWDPASVHRTFHIGLVGYASLFLVPALMLMLRTEAPGIQLLVDYMSAGHANRLLGGPNLDFAIGTLPNKNPAHLIEPLSVDRFVVIARRSHPEIAGNLSREEYTRLEHVRIPIYAGIVDQSLRSQGVTRSFSIELENVLAIPFLVSRSNLLATVPERLAFVFRGFCKLNVFAVPFNIPYHRVNVIWHRRAQNDPAHAWLRKVLQTAANDIYRDLGAPAGAPAKQGHHDRRATGVLQSL